MRPDIDPKVDYAFKKLFGREQSTPLLLDLLHAVLRLPPAERIVSLEIRNPFNDKTTLDDKLSIVDIKARDQLGRLFDVEMQMVSNRFLKDRILYYWPGCTVSSCVKARTTTGCSRRIPFASSMINCIQRYTSTICSFACGNSSTGWRSAITW